MKNLKKLLAVIITVAMVTALVAVPISAVEVDDAIKLETMGVLLGTGSGVDTAYRASVPMRYQAAWLFLRLLGKEADAKIWAGTLNFADAASVRSAAGNPLTAENQKMLAYLYAHQNLGYRGYTNDTFRPFTLVNAQMYYKLMLVTLGYVEGTDFVWANVLDKAVEFGVITTKPDNAAAFTIDSLATATIAALQATLKDGTKTLIAKLVEDDKSITAASAIAAGIYEAPVVALEVTGVTATDLGEITVTFNKAVDATLLKTAGNVKIDAINVASIALSTDGMTAVLTVPTPRANGSTYALVIKAAVGLAADYSASVRVFDTALPVVTSMVLTGPQTFVITFSERLAATAGTVKINNGIYGISSLVISGKTVTGTLASASLPAATYSVEVAGYADLAGFVMATDTLSWVYAVDVTAPTVSVVSATQTSVIVEFSEPVTGATTAADYAHTFTAYVANTVALVSGNQYKVTFTTNPIPAGTTTLYIAKTNIVDAWGNHMAAAASLPVTVVADTTAPTVTQVKFINETTIEVYFSESVTEAAAETVANFVVKLAGVAKAVSTAVYDDTAKKTTITMTAALAGGSYTIDVKNVTDMALVKNTMAAYTGTFTAVDMTPPITTGISATIVKGIAGGNDIIYVTYPEAMNATALDTSNYMIDQNNTDPTAAVLLTAKAVTIEAYGATGYKITRAFDALLLGNGTSDLVIGRVQDASGNALEAFSINVKIINEAAPAVTSIKQTSANTFAVLFNKALTSATLDAFTFKVVDDSVYYIPASISMATASGLTTVNFTITSDAVTAFTTVVTDYVYNTAKLADDAAVIKLVAGKVTSETGMTNLGADLTETVVDARAPYLVSATAVGANAVLTFSENIDSTPGYCAFDLLVRASATGAYLTPGVDYVTTISGTTVIVDIVNPAVTTMLTYLITGQSTIRYIKDATGNLALTFAERAVQ